jgi:hypothetical protein
LSKGDFFIEECFQFERKWYGVLRVEGYSAFLRYVSVTHFYPGGCDWISINDTLEKAVRYFHTQKNR